MNSYEETGPRILYGTGKLEGACLDSGAAQSVFGTYSSRAYTDITGRAMIPHNYSLTFSFGYGERPSKGVIEIRIPLQNCHHVAVGVHLLATDIPILQGMEVLCHKGLILNFGTGVIGQQGKIWRLPMFRKNGHVFIEWGEGIYVTSTVSL